MRVPVAKNRQPLELQMTPMIDVVFLLLVFFLWTSSFEKPEYQLPSSLADLPTAGGKTVEPQATVEPIDELVVRIRWQNQNAVLQCNQETVGSIADLNRKFQQIIAIGVLPPVIVDPDPQVPIGTAIEVYDAARLAGLDRVLFAARADE